MAATATKKKDTTVTASAVYAQVAERKGIDPQRAGKLVRSFMRRHDADLREQFNYPPKDKVHADGNRYSAMPRECADYVIERLSTRGGNSGGDDQ